MTTCRSRRGEPTLALPKRTELYAQNLPLDRFSESFDLFYLSQSKYISKLKKVADRRKLEQDIIYERKVQREMEEEGLEYGDKDTFLTSAYRKKLEERKLMEEELKEAAKREGVCVITCARDFAYPRVCDYFQRHRMFESRPTCHDFTETCWNTSPIPPLARMRERKRSPNHHPLRRGPISV